MTRALRGTVRGRTIQLDEDPGMADGQGVEVILQPAKDSQPWGAGIKRSAGVAAHDPEFDSVFEEIARDRKAARFREQPS